MREIPQKQTEVLMSPFSVIFQFYCQLFLQQFVCSYIRNVVLDVPPMGCVSHCMWGLTHIPIVYMAQKKNCDKTKIQSCPISHSHDFHPQPMCELMRFFECKTMAHIYIHNNNYELQLDLFHNPILPSPTYSISINLFILCN